MEGIGRECGMDSFSPVVAFEVISQPQREKAPKKVVFSLRHAAIRAAYPFASTHKYMSYLTYAQS
jgi:hypothetical protein